MTTDPADSLKPLADLLDTLTAEQIVPAALRVDWPHTDPGHPHLVVWLRYRTDLQRVAARLGLRVESTARAAGHREYWTRGDGPGVLLLAASLAHHDDYEEGK